MQDKEITKSNESDRTVINGIVRTMINRGVAIEGGALPYLEEADGTITFATGAYYFFNYTNGEAYITDLKDGLFIYPKENIRSLQEVAKSNKYDGIALVAKFKRGIVLVWDLTNIDLTSSKSLIPLDRIDAQEFTIPFLGGLQ